MLYLGLMVGVAAGNLAAHAAGVDAFRAYVATLILVVPALSGARLLYVAARWKTYRRNLRRIVNRREGGYVMYGGLFPAVLLSIPLLHVLRLRFGAFWDVSAFTILAGMICTRLGCLLNGCCAGRPSTAWFSLCLPNTQGVWERRVPTQLFEAGWAAVLLVSSAVIWRWMPFDGALFLAVTAGYASGRLVMEFARAGEPDPGRFSIAQAISVIAILSSVSTLAICW